MGKNVTVNLFDVSWQKAQKLSETLDEFLNQRLAERWRNDIRLETVEKLPADEMVAFSTYALNFAKSREIGPGRLARTAAIGDIGLNRDEQFGEETSALYVPAKKWLLILGNHYGVGPSRMAEYFNALDPGDGDRHFDYIVSPKIDVNALKRMKAMTHFSQVVVTANVGAFEHAEGDVGESVKQAAQAVHAERLHLKLDSNKPHRKGDFLRLREAKVFINSMLNNAAEVDKLEVKGGGGDANEKDQVIDLLTHKLRRKYPESELVVVNHRYTAGSKTHLLRKACRGWVDALK